MKLNSLVLIPCLIAIHPATGQISNSWEFRKELISYMEKPADTIYIQDRKQLEKIHGLQCNDTSATFDFRTKSGESIYLSIHSKPFDASSHTTDLTDTTYVIVNNEKRIDHIIVKGIIDGKQAYGVDGGYPKSELNDIKIKWNGSWLVIPDSAFHNLYEVHLCNKDAPVEAYLANHKSLLYIYISASDGAGSYSVKFIFNRQKYITRIINRNEITDGYDFLDATAKTDEE